MVMRWKSGADNPVTAVERVPFKSHMKTLYDYDTPRVLKSLSIMPDAERQFVDLIFYASTKYGSWDPEVTIAVGDYGRVTRGETGLAFWRKNRGIFLKEGNIYEEGLAEKYNIPAPEERGVDSTEGISWITSNNAKEVDISAEISA